MSVQTEPDLPRLPAGSKVLVTGAGGFIGGRLAECLDRQGDLMVRGLVRNRRKATRLHPLDVEIIEGSVADRRTVERAATGVDYIFHCAYDAGAPADNIEGLRHLIAAAATARVERLIHVSSFAVYQPFPRGDLSEGASDGDRSIGYVDNKLALERLVFEACRSGLKAAIVQPAIVYGPGCWVWTIHPAAMLLAGDVVLPDAGAGICNAVYVDDVVQSLLLSAISPSALGERFIIAGADNPSWATFYAQFTECVKAGGPVFWPLGRIVEEQNRTRAAAQPATKRTPLHRSLAKQVKQHRVFQALLNLAPRSVRARVNERPPTLPHAPEGRFVPDRSMLNLYTAMAVARSSKARDLIGYSPRYNFASGMQITCPYLRITFGKYIS